jgi:hypothetical protein
LSLPQPRWLVAVRVSTLLTMTTSAGSGFGGGTADGGGRRRWATGDLDSGDSHDLFLSPC